MNTLRPQRRVLTRMAQDFSSRIVSLDLASNNCGFAVMLVDKGAAEAAKTKAAFWAAFDVKHIYLIKPGASKSKNKTQKGVDRCGEMIAGLGPLIAIHKSTYRFAEIPTSSQDHRSATSKGHCESIVATIDFISNGKTTLVTPQKVKAITGKRSASKNEMIAWAKGNWPMLMWTGSAAKNEHMADAIAAGIAGYWDLING